MMIRVGCRGHRFLMVLTALVIMGIWHIPAVAGATVSVDTTEQLSRLSGYLLQTPRLRVERIPADTAFLFGLRLDYPQPVDHRHPDSATFHQRVHIYHRGFQKPTVLVVEGYGLYLRHQFELSRMLDANQIVVEHRYFGPSRPDSLDWDKLTLWQASSDLHAIVQRLKALYRGPWLSTGISKGGQNALAYRYYFPDDVKATVAYVAPINRGVEDSTITRFIRRQGGDSCSQRIRDFQLAVLAAEDSAVATLRTYQKQKKLNLFLPPEQILEYALVEFPFSFWQLSRVACRKIPDAGVGPDSLFSFLKKIVPLNLYSEPSIQSLHPAFVMFYRELGYYSFAYNDPQVLKKLRYVHNPSNRIFLPPGVKLSFNDTLMVSIRRWLLTNGKGILTVYGQRDPWGSTGLIFPPEDAANLTLLKPDGNHATRIRHFSSEEQAKALAFLQHWLELVGTRKTERHPRQEVHSGGRR